MSARLNVQILASQCGPARTAFACKNWRTGPAKLAQLGRAEAIGQCKSELRSLFAPKRALLFCYFCPRVNQNNIPKYVYLFWVANSQTLFENRILDLKICVVKYDDLGILLFVLLKLYNKIMHCFNFFLL